MYHSQGNWRSLVEGPTAAPIESSSYVLASKRTHRKDPLDGFKKYTKGWNISERHYWAVSFSNYLLSIWPVLLSLIAVLNRDGFDCHLPACILLLYPPPFRACLGLVGYVGYLVLNHEISS